MARQLQWQAPDGTLITLTDKAAGYRLLADATTGLNSPPYRFTTDTYAGVDGITVQSVSAGAREVTLGLMVQASDLDDFRDRIAALTRAMRPKPGPGTLIVSREDGRTRLLSCYYTEGLEGDEARGAMLPGRWWKAAVHLLAADPWWYGETQTFNVGLGEPTTFFPIFPLRLSPSSVQGEFTVDLSDTDDPTYPLWTVTGPGSQLVLANESTGARIEVNTTLATGETLTIDTRPGLQSVRAGEDNLMGFLGSDPALWPLIEGVNRVTASLSGATSDSRIAATFRPRYAGA